MLTIGKLKRDSGQIAGYYAAQVAGRPEQYYAGEGEASGGFRGLLATSLGLDGEVGELELRRLLEGRHPASDEKLAERRPGVLAYDLVFKAPKSVSLVHTLGDDATRAAVTAAHEHAVEAGLEYLERRATWTRLGKNGAERVRGQGLLSASFRHRLSRDGDPHLHTHVVTANGTYTPDGRWRTLDGAALYQHAQAAGHLYQAQLRAELSRDLGVEWQPVRNGVADLKGVARPVIEAFSRRAEEIAEWMAAHGARSAKAARAAADKTKAPKDRAVSLADLLPEWRERAAALGLDGPALEALAGRMRAPQLSAEEERRVLDQLGSERGLTARASAFDRRDVVRAVAGAAGPGADAAAVEALADRFLRSDGAVVLAEGGRGLGERDVIRRGDGRVVPVAAEETRYSTPGLLALQSGLVEAAIAGAGDGRVTVDAASVEATIVRQPRALSDEQAQMVRTLTTSGAAVQVVIGQAGAGKTSAIAAARAAWEGQGVRVIGTALSARAALELRDQAGVESFTLARLLGELGDPRFGSLARGCVVIVDEASMVGDRSLAALHAHVERAAGKLVLLGDDRQIPAIEAGGASRALAARGGPLGLTVELTENRRQRELWEREALALLRDGEPAEAIAAYQRHGRVSVAEDPQALRAAIVADWWEAAAREGPQGAVMITSRLADAAELNARARELMRLVGRLDGPELAIGGRLYRAGDRVMATDPSAKHLGLVNGQRAIVTGVDLEARGLQARRDDGAALELGSAYLESGRLHHGYAITAHKAQGMTTERAFLLGSDALYRELAYVGLSRGREENRLYVVAPDVDQDLEGPARPERLGAVEGAVRALERTRAHEAGTDVQARAQIEDRPTAGLRREHSQLKAILASFPAGTQRDAAAATVPARPRSRASPKQGRRSRRANASWRRSGAESAAASRAGVSSAGSPRTATRRPTPSTGSANSISARAPSPRPRRSGSPSTRRRSSATPRLTRSSPVESGSGSVRSRPTRRAMCAG